MLIAARIGLLAVTWCAAFGQTADKALTFDAASIKPGTAPVLNGGAIRLVGPSGGPGSTDPGRIHYPYTNLKFLLITAYNVKNYQINGPAWLDTERFDIDATMPAETTKEQFRTMLQNLLAERFKLAVHRETKELPVYSLVVANNGPKMKESVQAPPPTAGDSPPPPSRPQIGPDGFPVLPAGVAGRGGIFNIMMPGRSRMIGAQQTMADLADRLTGVLNRPVTDATGLTAKYDFVLTFVPPEGMVGPMGPMPPPPPPPGSAAAGSGNDSTFRPDGEAPAELFTAIQAQLGLKLEAKKGPVTLIVVDHMEKTPTEN